MKLSCLDNVRKTANDGPAAKAAAAGTCLFEETAATLGYCISALLLLLLHLFTAVAAILVLLLNWCC